MTSILLIGASGQIGWELARTLPAVGNVLAVDRTNFDLSELQTLGALIDAARPTVIVNAAAYTAVDDAEKHEGLAMTINAEAPGEIARAAHRLGALMVHYSTDYVFDGAKTGPYTEDDDPHPLGAYARSKLAGEDAVRQSGAAHLIFRTSWIYAARGKNFVRTMLRLAAEREELRVVADQVGAPTWARLVAEVTARALAQDLPNTRKGGFESGTFHLAAGGETSWHGFATAIVSGARERGAKLKCTRITPITTAEYPLPAQRPANSRLACERLKKRYGMELPRWEEGLRACLDEIFAAP